MPPHHRHADLQKNGKLSEISIEEDVATVASLRQDLDKLKKQLTCLICHELLFEPCALPCGHVFCYGCNLDWLKSHKNCPTCRRRVTQKPTFVYLIKEMCETLADRIELDSPLGEGKVVRERQAEQRALMRKDENDLFPGLFKDFTRGRNYTHGGRMYDREDHVIRCSACHWELEDIYECLQCGISFGDLSEDDPQDRDFLDAIGPLADALGWEGRLGDNDSFGGDEDEDEDEDIEGDDDGRPNAYDLDDSFVDDRPTSEIDLTQGDGTFFDEEEESEGQSHDRSSERDSDELVSSAAPPPSRRSARNAHQVDAEPDMLATLSSSYEGPIDDDMADYAFDQMDEHVPEDDSEHSRPSTTVCNDNDALPRPAVRPATTSVIYDLTTDSPERVQRANDHRRSTRSGTSNSRAPSGRSRAPRIFIDSDDGE